MLVLSRHVNEGITVFRNGTSSITHGDRRGGDFTSLKRESHSPRKVSANCRSGGRLRLIINEDG